MKIFNSPNFTDSLNTPHKVIVHIMGGNIQSCDQWFMNVNSRASAHYGISKIGEIHQYVPENRIAWHAGIGDLTPDIINDNNNAIGIEHEGYDLNDWTDAELQSSYKLVDDICNRYKIDINNTTILLHSEISSNKPYCPSQNHNFKNRYLMGLIKYHYDKLYFTIKQPLKQIYFMQGIGENKPAYKDVLPTITGGHIGIDLQYGYGDNITALWDGEVVYTQEDSIVQLCDVGNETLEITYSHGSQQQVKKGQNITQGSVISQEGCVGPSISWKLQTTQEEKIAWAHLHLGGRLVIRNVPESKSLLWNFSRLGTCQYSIIESDPSREHFIDLVPYSMPLYVIFINEILKKLQYQYSYFDMRSKLIVSKETVRQFMVNINMTKSDIDNVFMSLGLNNDDMTTDMLLNQLEYAKKYNYVPIIAYPESAIIEGGKWWETLTLRYVLTLFKKVWNTINQDKQ